MFSNIRQSLHRNSARLALIGGLALAAAAQAHAEVPTEITEITTNVSTVWTTVKGIVIGVVAFVSLLGFVKMVRKK